MSMALVLIIAFALDLLLGDPEWLPHPVVAIGKAITALERRIRPVFPATPFGEIMGGSVLALAICLATGIAGYALIRLAGLISPGLGFAAETFLLYQCLAAKCLRDAARAVHRELARGDLAAAREMVGRIVGRDTARLDESAVTRAAVETVAENTSDGVVAPIFFFLIGGAPLALLYKAVNTMDSMLGYKNAKYLHFGRAAARLDDVANFLPARLTGLLMIPAAFACGLDWKNALRVLRRDRLRHASPNSGHPEAACAGALGVRLGGDSDYDGVTVAKPAIGDAIRDIVPDDIQRSVRLLYATSVLCLALGCDIAVALGALSWN